MSPYVKFRGWCVWACLRTPDNSGSVLQALSCPARRLGSIETAKGRAGVLAAARRRRQDRRERLPRSAAASRLPCSSRLREAGFVPDLIAAATLFRRSFSRQFAGRGVLRARLLPVHQEARAPAAQVLTNKEVWATRGRSSAVLARPAEGTSLADHLTKLGIGLPDYKAFAPRVAAAPAGSSRRLLRWRLTRHQSRSRLADVVTSILRTFRDDLRCLCRFATTSIVSRVSASLPAGAAIAIAVSRGICTFGPTPTPIFDDPHPPALCCFRTVKLAPVVIAITFPGF